MNEFSDKKPVPVVPNPSPVDGGFLAARGVLGWQEGDEPAEVSIRRLRDGETNTGHYLVTYEEHGKEPKFLTVVHTWKEACEYIRWQLDVEALDDSAWEKGDGQTDYVIGDAAYVVRWIP